MQESMEKEWVVASVVPSEIRQSLTGFSPIMQQLLYNRGISSIESAENFLNLKNLSTEYDPFLLRGMPAAVNRIKTAIAEKEKIAVFGDYDVDGITATAVLFQALEDLGAAVIHYIPNRIEEGYGVNKEAIDSLYQENVKLLVTVDCGIRSPNELGYAKTLGMDVIITDHHSPAEMIPRVDAVICQHQPGDTYPDKYLAGVGLAYKLAQALYGVDKNGDSRADQWLDLVALGTVADVVPLVGENRLLVSRGISTIRRGERSGLASLIRAASLNLQRLSATDISFGIAPRLNAAGRLESPQKALQILLTKDQHEAAVLAQELDDLNRKRQELTKMNQEIVQSKILEDDLILFAADEELDTGLVGLVAARLTEFYYRPAIVGYQKDGYTRASCRSIPEFHITNALDECEDLLIQHGGHAMAAGFTVLSENLDLLIFRLREIAKRDLHVLPKRTLVADLEIPLREIPPNVLGELDQLEPFGAENDQPVFISKNVEVVRHKAVGRDQNHLKLSCRDGNQAIFDAIAFQQGFWAKAMPKKIDIIYSIEHNFYNNNDFTQLVVRDIKAA